MPTKDRLAKMSPEARVKRNHSNRKFNRQYNWKKLGLEFTDKDYEQMFNLQEGRCKICSRTDTRRLHVDHLHGTPIVRGLLCSPCNRALGLFGDNSDTLRTAAEYLEG